jgi:toxin ParE1/3/4
VLVLPAAERDLEQYASYFARQRRPLAKRFLTAAKQTFRHLLRMPYLGGLWETDHSLFAELRVWPVQGFENHLIFYRPTSQGIEVYRVLHGSRDLETIFGSPGDSA